MAYIGNDLRSNEDYKIIDDISSGFNGSATSFALQVGGATPVPFPKFEQQLLISVNGVIQEPDPTGSAGFKLLGTNIVFSSAPTNGHAFFGVIYAGADYVNAGGTFPDGSINFPSITFSADTNTGFTRTASGTVALISDGTKVAQFPTSQGSSGQALITDGGGNLSFGVPTAAFTDITLADSIIHSGDTNTKIKFPAADTVSVETAGTERIRVASNGDIGIGTTTLNRADAGRPLVQFDYSGADGSEGVELRLSNSAINGNAATDNAAITYIGQTLGITNRENGTIQFRNNGSERMRILANGNIGIGTTSPALLGGDGGRVLHLAGTANPEIVLERTTSGTEAKASIRITDTEDLRIAVKDGSASTIDALTIDSTTGHVGIADISPDARLVVRGSASAPHAVFKVSSQSESTLFTVQTVQDSDVRIGTQTDHPLTLYVNQNERMRIDTSGRVLMGTSTQFGDGNDKLMIENGTTGGRLTFGSSAGFAEPIIGQMSAYWADNKKVAAISFFGGSDTSNKDDGTIRFATSSANNLTERMRIDSSGNIGIGANPLSRLSVVDSVSSGHLMVIRNNQTRANGVRYGIEFRDSSNETNGSIAAVQTGSNNQASFEFYVNNGNGGNGITGGTSGIKSVTIGPGGLIAHKEFNMHNADGTAAAKFLDFGFQGNSCNFRRTNGGDGGHANFLTVNSSNVVSGDLNDTSDEKLKKNILSVVDGAIENIKKLRPVTFDWIDETRNNDVSGFVAQEVKEVLPNLINGTEYDPTLIDETKGSKGGIKSEGYSINTIGLVAHLTKALQESIAKIETLETKVTALEAS